MKPWALVLTAIASAICTLLSSAPFGFGLAAFAAPMFLLLIALHAKSTRCAVLLIYVVQIPLWLWLHSWVAEVAFAGWIGLGLYLSAWAPLFVLLIRRVHANAKISLVLSAPIIWVGLECLRGIIIFDGYPWYLAGTGIVDWPIVSIASAGSVWSASFLVVAIAAALATAKQVKRWTWMSLTIVCLFFFFQGIQVDKQMGAQIEVAVIQTNVHQDNKVAWDWERQLVDVSGAIEMTIDSVLGGPVIPSLVVWPETMLPGSGFEVSPIDFSPWEDRFVPDWIWPEKIREVAKQLDTPILLGSQTHIDVEIKKDERGLWPDASSIFNSAVLVFPSGETQRYDKIFLTPFGEKIPYVHLFTIVQNWVRETFGAAMLFDLDPGGNPNRFTLACEGPHNTVSEITFATPICFEDTVPFVVRDLIWVEGKRKAGALINLSNDGWFGNNDGARLQHIREARMRCIENMTPMVRAVNTGLSCSIDSRGNIQEVATVNGERAIRQNAIMYAKVFEGTELPLSRFVGDWVAWLSLFGGILLVIRSTFKRSKENGETGS
jgi:apolipoprotein N-acyltransferase